MNTQQLDAHIERDLEALRCEFAGRVPADHVTQIGNDQFEKLSRDATINDFIPLLVYRQTREELLSCEHDDLHRAA
jgi:hypothetical protein